jgi:hypothetical protein
MAKSKGKAADRYGVVNGWWVKGVGYRLTSGGKISAATHYLTKVADDPKGLGADAKVAAIRIAWAAGEGVEEIDHDGRRVRVWSAATPATPLPRTIDPDATATPSAPTAPKGETVADLFAAFIATHRDRSEDHYATLRTRLGFVSALKVNGRQVRELTAAELDAATLEALVKLIASRPPSRKSKTTRPISIPHAKGCNQWTKAALLWAAEEGRWSMPPKFNRYFKKAKPLANEDEYAASLQLRAANGDDGRYFPVDELALLYAQASDRERLWLCLSLNCGFGPMELHTLRRFEIESLDGDAPFIHRHRTKTVSGTAAVYAKWGYLFPETVALLKKFIAEDGIGPKDFVVRTSSGERMIKTLYDGDGNPTGRYDNFYRTFKHLKNRAKRNDKPRDLSPKYLRKTGGRMIRFMANLPKSAFSPSALASMYLSHGDRGEGDAILSDYSERDWDALVPALKQLRRELDRMFKAQRTKKVKPPTTDEQREERRAIMAKARAKLAVMKAEGFDVYAAHRAKKEAAGV